MCNCEFCIKCDCGHSADSHMAGDGQCYVCNCGQFHSRVMDDWDFLTPEQQSKWNSFQEYANNWYLVKEFIEGFSK